MPLILQLEGGVGYRQKCSTQGCGEVHHIYFLLYLPIFSWFLPLDMMMISFPINAYTSDSSILYLDHGTTLEGNAKPVSESDVFCFCFFNCSVTANRFPSFSPIFFDKDENKLPECPCVLVVNVTFL